MTADVPKSPGPEIPPTAPFERKIGGVIGAHRSRANPQIPIQRGRNRRRLCRPLHSLRPVFVEETLRRAISPNMHLTHWPNRSGPNKFAKPASLVRGLALIAHLRGNFGVARSLGELAGLPHRVRQWFLAINVFPMLDGFHRRENMVMVRRGDDHTIDFLHLIERSEEHT